MARRKVFASSKGEEKFSEAGKNANHSNTFEDEIFRRRISNMRRCVGKFHSSTVLFTSAVVRWVMKNKIICELGAGGGEEPQPIFKRKIFIQFVIKVSRVLCFMFAWVASPPLLRLCMTENSTSFNEKAFWDGKKRTRTDLLGDVRSSREGNFLCGNSSRVINLAGRHGLSSSWMTKLSSRIFHTFTFSITSACRSRYWSANLFRSFSSETIFSTITGTKICFRQ